MSSVDVGDTVEITFNTTAGATVAVTLLDPSGATVLDQVPVTENPTGSGAYPHTFLLTAPGVWTAQYTASGTTTQIERYYVRANSLSGPAPLATTGEVAGQFGTLTTTQQSLTATLLRAASRMVRQQYPFVDERIANGSLDAEVVALAVVSMVLRVLRNPSGLRSETVGPFSRSFDTQAAAGLLVITADEAALLTGRPNIVPASTIMVRAGLAPWPHGIHHPGINHGIRRW